MIHTAQRRMTMGTPVMDDLLGGGLTPGAVALLDAPPFLGGRLFTGQIIRANLETRDCTVVSTELPVATYRAQVLGGRGDPTDARFTVIDATGLAGRGDSWGTDGPSGHDLGGVNDEIHATHDTRRDRAGPLVIVDSVSTLLLQSGTRTTYVFLRQLIHKVRRLEGCILMSLDAAMHERIDRAAVRHLADLVIEFDQERDHRRIVVQGAELPTGRTTFDLALSGGSIEVSGGSAGGTIL